MNVSKYLEKMQSRLIALLEQEDDPQAAMRRLGQTAEESGLLAPGAFRTDSPLQFAIDLLTGNPAAHDWMNAKVDEMEAPRDPSRFESLDEIDSVLSLTLRD
jgi:hypothetical protein